jgi:hypothetical protein
MHPLVVLNRVSAAALERESGIQLESSSIAQLRAAVEGGRWDEARGLIEMIGVINEHAAIVRAPLLASPSSEPFSLQLPIRQADVPALLEWIGSKVPHQLPKVPRDAGDEPDEEGIARLAVGARSSGSRAESTEYAF